MGKKIAVCLSIDKALHEKAGENAKKEKRTVSATYEMAMEQFLKQHVNMLKRR